MRSYLNSRAFLAIESDKKTIEGRLHKNFFKEIEIEDIWTFFNDEGDEVIVKVMDIRHYETIREYLEKEGLKKTVPYALDLEDGIRIYRQFYSEEKEIEYGVVAFEIKKV